MVGLGIVRPPHLMVIFFLCEKLLPFSRAATLLGANFRVWFCGSFSGRFLFRAGKSHTIATCLIRPARAAAFLLCFETTTTKSHTRLRSNCGGWWEHCRCVCVCGVPILNGWCADDVKAGWEKWLSFGVVVPVHPFSCVFESTAENCEIGGD